MPWRLVLFFADGYCNAKYTGGRNSKFEPLKQLKKNRAISKRTFGKHFLSAHSTKMLITWSLSLRNSQRNENP
jgi:hypothetical protein